MRGRARGRCDDCLYFATIRIHDYDPKPYCARYGRYERKPNKAKKCVRPIDKNTNNTNTRENDRNKPQRDLPPRP